VGDASVSVHEDALQELRAAVADLRAEIERCPESEWLAVVPNGWTRAAVAMHAAMGNDVATAWIAYLISGRDILDTADFHDRMNGRLADRTRSVTRGEVLDTLERTTERATDYISSLTDDELDMPANFGIAQRDTTARRFLPGLARHIRGHTDQFKAGL
jgi:hypothetical protein